MGHKAGFDGDNLFDIGSVEFDNLASKPANPSSGHLKLYIKNGEIFKLDEFGNESPLEVRNTANFTFDVLDFGDDDDVKNKFLKYAGTDHKAYDSTAIALKSGEVFAVTVSTEKKPENDFAIQIIKNATKQGSGTWKGGTQIGTDLVKPVGVLDHIFENLTGFTFNKGDRIAVYIKKGSNGSGKAEEPAVRVFLKYNAS